jgi:uncharacterized secreted protein with C-terminal beta-propeller domain
MYMRPVVSCVRTQVYMQSRERGKAGRLTRARTRALTLTQSLKRAYTHTQVQVRGFEVNFDEDVGVSDDSLPVLVSYVQMHE